MILKLNLSFNKKLYLCIQDDVILGMMSYLSDCATWFPWVHSLLNQTKEKLKGFFLHVKFIWDKEYNHGWSDIFQNA
jgi:hypothetical protein